MTDRCDLFESNVHYLSSNYRMDDERMIEAERNSFHMGDVNTLGEASGTPTVSYTHKSQSTHIVPCHYMFE